MVLFNFAFLINAAHITMSDASRSRNIMLLGLGLPALYVAGIGTGRSRGL